MKEQTQTKKSFLKKHWSNIVFIVLLIIILIPKTRAYFQSWIVIPLIGSPEIMERNEDSALADYNLVLKDLQGNLVYLNKSKPKPMLINFWATWCSPCIAELPGLVELYNEFGHRVDFYFVSNENKDILQKFLDIKELKIPVFNPASKIPDFYETNAIPTTYLISSEGKVIAKAEGMANWDSDTVKEIIRKL